MLMRFTEMVERRRRSERSYHHGNLKEALVRAALALIAEKGPAGFTFADAARWAGVSPAAPYRHYRDREELLADVARRGFEQFEQRLVQAWNEGSRIRKQPSSGSGKAYPAFARAEPAFYSAMFEAGIPADASPELRAAGDRAFADRPQCLRGARGIQLPQGKRPPARLDDGPAYPGAFLTVLPRSLPAATAPKRSPPMSPEDLLEAGCLSISRVSACTEMTVSRRGAIS